MPEPECELKPLTGTQETPSRDDMDDMSKVVGESSVGEKTCVGQVVIGNMSNGETPDGKRQKQNDRNQTCQLENAVARESVKRAKRHVQFQLPPEVISFPQPFLKPKHQLRKCRTSNVIDHAESDEVGTRHREAPQLDVQVRVCGGTPSLWSPIPSEGADLSRSEVFGQRMPHARESQDIPKGKPRSAGHEEAYHSQEGRTTDHVRGTRDSRELQEHGGGTSHPSTSVGNPAGEWRDGHGLRQVEGKHLHGGNAERPTVLPLGSEGGQGEGGRLEASSVCSLGGEDQQVHGATGAQGDRSVIQWERLPRERTFRERRWDGEAEGHRSDRYDGPHGEDAGRARRAEGSPSQEGSLEGSDRGQLRTGVSEEDNSRRNLSGPQQRALTQSAENLIPQAWAAVTERERLFLLEVACSEDSILSHEAQAVHGKRAQRCSIWNGHDLSTAEGVRKTVEVVRRENPKFVWISTECGAFSPIQNCNQRTPQQTEELKKKQALARRQHVGGLIVAKVACEQGSIVSWEWSRRCRAWSWEPIEKWRHDWNTHTAIIGGCRVNLRDPKTNRFLGKEWRVESTHEGLTQKIHSPCTCDKKQNPHAVCEGSLTRKSAFYTKEMARKVVYHMVHLETHEDIQNCLSLDGNAKQQPKTSVDVKCWCEDVNRWNEELICSGCMTNPSSLAFVGEEAEGPVVADVEPEGEVVPEVSSEEERRILKNLSLIHSSTGHGSYASLLKALKARNCSPRVIEIASKFRCSACEEHKRPTPRKRANLEVCAQRWHSIQADVATWKHPKTNKKIQVLVLIDECTRFVVADVVREDGTSGVKPQDYIDFFNQRWKPYFGVPDIVRADPEGSWRSKAIEGFFQQQGVNLDLIPAEAHWNLTHVERTIEWLKEFLSKYATDNDELTYSSLVTQAVYTWNQREKVRGHSPFQHALGREPDENGRFSENPIHDLPLEMMANPDGEIERAEQLRADAEKCFIDWQLQEKLGRARNSRHHAMPSFVPGDLVFYWRTTVPGNEQHSWNRGKYLGPSRILALETRAEEDGTLRPSSVAWLIKGNRLVKVAVEQIRHASAREANLHELERPANLPWTFSGIMEGVRKGDYDDHRGPAPSPTARGNVEAREERPAAEGEPPPRRRRTGKQPEGDQEVPAASSGSARSRLRSRSAPRGGRSLLTVSPPWQDHIENSFWQTQDSNHWEHERACVEIEVDMPKNARGWKQFSRNAKNYFISALKRRTVEVSEKHLTAEEHEQFKGAKQTEVGKFVGAEALEALPPHLQPSKSQAMRMRWILTWKKTEDQGLKPKARAVVLGYQDPEYAHRPTFAPTMTKQSRQLLLQWAANNECSVKKGDVSGAFLQGREFTRDMYVIPTDEICKAMNIPSQSITRMKRACYGLVEAPIEWFETMNTFLQEEGFVQLKSDPSFWKLVDHENDVVALISGHVDDFLFTGREESQLWQEKQQRIKQRFQWQEWEVDEFVQCGVKVRRTSDGFELDQQQYLEEVAEIQLTKERRKQTAEATSEKEKTELRGLLGALSWHVNQVGFRYSAYVSLYLSEVVHSTVQTLLEVNNLLYKIKNASRTPMRIFGFKQHEQPIVFCWTDASSQNRHDGSSTKGIFIGMSGAKLEHGEVDRISPWFWQSGKIDRVCRSPGAAEARAAIDGEDSLYLCRYQWSEINGHPLDVHDPDSMVLATRGALVTDSRNVFDHLEKPYITPKGAQKRIDLELLTLKESQDYTDLIVRWVSAQAMLANSLTKRGEDFQMAKFVQLNQLWRIVDDENMFSGRKRKQHGKDVLDD